MTILLFLGKLALATVVPVAGVCLLLWVTGRPSRHTLRDLAKAAHDLADQEEYSRHVEKLARECTCNGVSRPCDGLLAGGLCDNLDLTQLGSDSELRITGEEIPPSAIRHLSSGAKGES